VGEEPGRTSAIRDAVGSLCYQSGLETVLILKEVALVTEGVKTSGGSARVLLRVLGGLAIQRASPMANRSPVSPRGGRRCPGFPAALPPALSPFAIQR
jgi:hypothetical protein